MSLKPIDFCHFIEKTNQCVDVQQAFTILQETLATLGFDRVVYSLITDNPLLQQKRGHGVLRNYPEDWMQYYKEKDYFHLDPVIKIIKQQSGAFHWDDLGQFKSLDKKETLLMNEAREATLYDGIGFSVHEAGRIIGMGAASSTGKIDKNPIILSLVNALCYQFHAFYYKKSRKAQTESISLSRRETEILCFTAEGKTQSEIAEILVISEDTVKTYFKRIYGKLGVNSNTLAVVKAITYGLIAPNIPHNYRIMSPK